MFGRMLWHARPAAARLLGRRRLPRRSRGRAARPRRRALATVALGAFVLGACCACACAAACWCAAIAYDADGGGGGPFSARRVLAALGAKEPPRRYARVRLNEDDATGGDIEMTLA